MNPTVLARRHMQWRAETDPKKYKNKNKGQKGKKEKNLAIFSVSFCTPLHKLRRVGEKRPFSRIHRVAEQ